VQGELVRLGHRIAASTVWQILHDAGLHPAPRRSGPTWTQFLTVQAKAVLAVDFLHVDTVFLRRIYALIAVEHGCRRAHLIGVTAQPAGAWTTQAARNLLMDLADRATTITFLLRDRDSRFTAAFDAVFAAEGIRILPSPPRAPRANAIRERMIGTLRRELLDRILIVNERHLRRILAVYLQHFNTARPHRTLGQLASAQAETQSSPVINFADHQIRRRPILGGLTSEYQICSMAHHGHLKPTGQAHNPIFEPHRVRRSASTSLRVRRVYRLRTSSWPDCANPLKMPCGMYVGRLIVSPHRGLRSSLSDGGPEIREGGAFGGDHGRGGPAQQPDLCGGACVHPDGHDGAELAAVVEKPVQRGDP
jgi:putative transposase